MNWAGVRLWNGRAGTGHHFQYRERIDRGRCGLVVFIFSLEVLMLCLRTVLCPAVLIFFVVGATGCGETPSTGESVQQTSESTARGKIMAEGYMKKAAEQKAQKGQRR
jgi:hypothetical protein